MVKLLLTNHDKLVKRFLVLTLVQQSGEATLDNVDELSRVRRELYRITRNVKK